MSEEIIRSRENRLIKHIRSLQIKKYRDKSGEYVIEGFKMVQEAIDYNVEISNLIISVEKKNEPELDKILILCKSRGINFNFVDESLYKLISDTQTPQGILATVKKTEYAINDIFEKKFFRVILLDEIKDPGNMGTIIRTADACNIDGVLLSEGCVDVYNSKTIRATMGSVFRVPILSGLDIDKILDYLHSKGTVTIGGDPYGDIVLYELRELGDKIAIVIGNESKGVKEKIKEKLTYKTKIPMPGNSESLNAAVAASIMMYEFFIRRN